MKLGKFTINLLDTGIFGLDGGPMFGVVPKNLWSKIYHPGDEMNRIPLSARPMLVRWDNRVVLVDTGNGTKLSEKITKIYGIDKEKSSMANALAPFSLTENDITDVILTHLHFDHAGGGTIIVDGELAPTFPNAKYYVQKTQYEWALKPSEKDRASYMPENYLPLMNSGQLEIIDGEGELFKGIGLMLSHGHTNGMQMVKINDGGDTLLYLADLCPTSAHLPVPYVMGYDNQPMITMEEKRRVNHSAFEENWILCYEHDAFKEASRIIMSEKGFSAGESILINNE